MSYEYDVFISYRRRALLFRQTLDLCCRVLGKTHPNTLITKKHLSNLLAQMAKEAPPTNINKI